MVTLERIWAAPYTELMAVLSSTRQKVIVPDDINIVRELVARVYYRKSMLDREDAVLLTNPSFREIMSSVKSDRTFNTKYVTLQINSLGLKMAKTTLRYEKEVIASLYITEPTLYNIADNGIDVRSATTLELKRVLRYPEDIKNSHNIQGSLYHDNKIFVLDRTMFFYIDLTTGLSTTLMSFHRKFDFKDGPYLMSGRVYIVTDRLLVYYRGEIFQASEIYDRLFSVTFDKESQALVICESGSKYTVIKANAEPYSFVIDDCYPQSDPKMVSDVLLYFNEYKGITMFDSNGIMVGSFEHPDRNYSNNVIRNSATTCLVSNFNEDRNSTSDDEEGDVSSGELPLFQIEEYTLDGKFIRDIKFKGPLANENYYNMSFHHGRLILSEGGLPLVSLDIDTGDIISTDIDQDNAYGSSYSVTYSE
jgi:hypothetical protein